MKLTTKSEYSILTLIYIARNQNGGYVKMDDICNKYDISKKYLEQIINYLKQGRLVKTKTGSSGGLKLAEPPEKISVAKVIRLMDGALAPTLAVSKYFFEHTPFEKEKKVMDFFQEIRDYVSRKVEGQTIADLV